MSTTYERLMTLHNASPVFDTEADSLILPIRPFLRGLDIRETTRGRPLLNRIRTIEGEVLLAPVPEFAGIYIVRLWHSDLLTTAVVQRRSDEFPVDINSGTSSVFGVKTNLALTLNAREQM